MNNEALMEQVRKQMPDKRWRHVQGVMESAVELANRYGADPDKAYLAALLHDYAKYWPLEKQKKVIMEGNFPEELLHYGSALWHAPVAAYIAETQLGIHDEDVLRAIRYHTSGRENMSKLEKIICLADYIEPGRQYPEVNRIRALAEESLENALLAGFDSTIKFLIEKGQKIYPLTIRARNHLIKEMEGKE